MTRPWRLPWRRRASALRPAACACAADTWCSRPATGDRPRTRLGPDRVELTLTAPPGQPFRPGRGPGQPVLPGPRPRPGPVALTGQWQLRVTIRSDDFDETTVIIPVTVH